MKARKQAGFGTLEAVLVVVIVGLLGFVGWYVWHSKNNADKNLNTAANTSTTTSLTKKSSTATKTATPDPYASWQTYTNSQVSFKYPSDWKASDGPGFSQSTIADATSPAFASSAMTTADNPGAQVTMYLQLSTDNLTIGCADAPCQVSAVAPLSNSQLPSAVLAVINQTSGNGTKFTEYVVASGNTKVGDTSVSPVKAGSSNIYVFGQPYYTPKDGGLTIAARVTDTASFKSDSHFKDLVSLINSIKF